MPAGTMLRMLPCPKPFRSRPCTSVQVHRRHMHLAFLYAPLPHNTIHRLFRRFAPHPDRGGTDCRAHKLRRDCLPTLLFHTIRRPFHSPAPRRTQRRTAYRSGIGNNPFLYFGFLCSKRMICFGKPRLRLFFILFTAEARKVHLCKVVHSKAVSFFGFNLHQGKGGIKIGRRLFCTIEKLTSLFILVSPP